MQLHASVSSAATTARKPALEKVDNSNADAANSSRRLALYSPWNLTSPISLSQRCLKEIGLKRGCDLAQASERLGRLDGLTQFSSEGVYVPTHEARRPLPV